MSWLDLSAGIKCIDPHAAAKILSADIKQILRNIEVAPDEETEIAHRETLAKWQAKFAGVAGCKPPRR